MAYSRTHHGGLHIRILGIFERDLHQGRGGAGVIPFAEREGQLIPDANGWIMGQIQQRLAERLGISFQP